MLHFPHRLFRVTALCLLMALAGAAHAQTLARPGWAGSGMSAAPWWRHAVVYQVDPRGFSGLHGLAERLDYIHSLGEDALLLTSLEGADPAQSIDPAVGTMDELDELVHRASQFNIRVLVELDAHSADLAARARLWLAHGVAGFHASGATAAQIAELKKAAGGFGGQRIVIGDVGVADAPAGRGIDAAQLVADPRTGTQAQLVADPRTGTQAQLAASAIRPALEASERLIDEGRSVPLLLSDGPSLKRSMTRYGDGAHDAEIAKAVAAMLMTTRSAAMLFYGQELGLPDGAKEIVFDTPKKSAESGASNGASALTSVPVEDANASSVVNWYRQLSALVHSNRAMSSGAMILLNHDDQNVVAWVRRPQSVSQNTPAIVVIENLSSQPVTLSLKADVQRLRLKGSFLRTLVRSDSGMGAMHLGGMTLAPYAVFIGELRY